LIVEKHIKNYTFAKLKILDKKMRDSYKYKGLRARLVEVLRQKGINQEPVLNAMLKIPRHLFMAAGFEERAYQDNAFPIAAGQTISQPYTVAFQTSLLNIKPGDKVLEIGTGSGYQAAVIAELGAKLYTLERQKELFKSAQVILKELGYFPYCYFKDGYEGLPTYGPFDKILVTAGAPEMPASLANQLKIGGILVAPIGPTDVQEMIKLTRLSETEFESKNYGAFSFVPMLTGKK